MISIITLDESELLVDPTSHRAARSIVMRLPCLAVCMVTTACALQTEAYLPHLDDNLIVSRLPVTDSGLEPTELEVVDSVLELSRGHAKSLSSMYVAAIRAAAMDEAADAAEISRVTVSDPSSQSLPRLC